MIDSVHGSESLARPRSDGSRVFFEMAHDGTVISCAISRVALQDLSNTRFFKAAELLKCFDEVRGQVEDLIREEMKARPDRVADTVTIWALDDASPASETSDVSPASDASADAPAPSGSPGGTIGKPPSATRAAPAKPQPEQRLTQFEVRDGVRRIICRISDEALDMVSGLTTPSSTVLRRKSFDRFRTLIDAAAKLKLKALGPDFVGPVLITTADLRCVRPEIGVPAFGSSPRGTTRAPDYLGAGPGDRAPG